MTRMRPLILAAALAFQGRLAAVTLTVWNQPAQARAAERQLWDEEADAFSKASSVQIRPISRPYIQQQFVSVMASGKGPDVAHIWVGALPTLARQGLLAPLDAEIKGWDQRDNIPAVLWNAATVDGKVYGVPRDSYVYVLLVRKDRWLAAGLDPAVPPADWNAFADAARRMRDKPKGIAGFGFAPTAEAFMDFVWQAGGELLREQGGRMHAAFNENPGVTALSFLRGLRFEDGVMQPNPLASRDELAQLFALGKVSMLMGTSGEMPDLINRYGLDPQQLLLFPLPAGPTGIQATHAGGDYFVVNAGASPQVKKAAFAYIAALLSPLNQLFRWHRMKELGIPIFPGAFSTTAQLNNLPEFKLVQETLNTARPEPYLPQWPQIKDHLETTLLQRLFTDPHADVEGSLNKAAADVEALYL